MNQAPLVNMRRNLSPNKKPTNISQVARWFWPTMPCLFMSLVQKKAWITAMDAMVPKATPESVSRTSACSESAL